jgi:hypothetical protein
MAGQGNEPRFLRIIVVVGNYFLFVKEYYGEMCDLCYRIIITNIDGIFWYTIVDEIPKVISVMISAARPALNSLYELGILHCDVNKRNFLYDERNSTGMVK